MLHHRFLLVQNKLRCQCIELPNVHLLARVCVQRLISVLFLKACFNEESSLRSTIKPNLAFKPGYCAVIGSEMH